MMRAEADVDSGKAKRELGWQPRPVEESVREAARFWVALKAQQTARKNTNNSTAAQAE
jgi:dihydroflavonol-4-reductase